MDARALHPGVEQAVRASLPARRPLRVLEVGGGAGGGFDHWMRVLAGVDPLDFTATDRDPALLRAYREVVGRPVRFRVGAVPHDFGGERYDLLLARSFWDLLPPGTAFRFAERVLAPGGVFYATLNFAGATAFEPPHPDDRRVLGAFHASMAHPTAGERLSGEAREAGFTEVGCGRSDWRVVPGGYPEDEASFLETILGFVEKEVGGAAAQWLSARRRQLAQRTLGYTARQFDVAAVRS